MDQDDLRLIEAGFPCHQVGAETRRERDTKPRILAELGEARGRAVVTYLQFAIDKFVDYNSKQTRWDFTRNAIRGSFSRHDCSIKWSFSEMVAAGPSSGFRWGVSQIIDSYGAISALLADASVAGSAAAAKSRYETLIQGIFAECRRELKPDGLLTLMFTQEGPDAWETLTNALIEAGWDITACMPVESESSHSTHQMNLAAAVSTIFIDCRPADRSARQPSSWASEVRGQLETAVREGLTEFARLNLNPVDRMIASWGRALGVYSEHWPFQDGDEEVPPTRAMQEAARVVAEEEVSRLSGGLVTVDDLDAESRLAVIALGINGLGEFAFDDALQMSRSLSFHLQQRNGNYRVSDDLVAYASVSDGGRTAPLMIRRSKPWLLKPEERITVPESDSGAVYDPALGLRLSRPATLWDTLHGLLLTYRKGGIVAARNYLDTHGKRDSAALRGLLKVWANECDDEALRREALLIDYEL